MSAGNKCITKDCKNYAQIKGSLCFGCEQKRSDLAMYHNEIRKTILKKHRKGE